MDDHGLMPSGCRVEVGIGGSGIVESFLSNGLCRKGSKEKGSTLLLPILCISAADRGKGKPLELTLD